MQQGKLPSTIVIGLALFSMFFGSGNLIFPLYMGQLAGPAWGWATVGFLLTAVLLPFAGVVAMVAFRGNYEKFFSIMGSRQGFWFAALLLTVWIPLGSGPRCIALSYASLSSYVSMPPIWLFSLGYSILLFIVVRNRHKMIEILGRYLTPALLCCLGLVVLKGTLWQEPMLIESAQTNLVWQGVLEGYNTMDLIAAFFFAASIIQMYCQGAEGQEGSLRRVLKASIVGVSLLASVYIGLMYLASLHGSALAGVPKEQLLAHIAKVTLGPQLGVVAAIAIVLACFTTSVALTSVYADFLSKNVFKVERRLPSAICGTLSITFVMSIFGLAGITAVTAPVLQVCYPVLIGLIVLQALVYNFREYDSAVE